MIDLETTIEQLQPGEFKNGRKSHRYRKKTVFDILGIAYEQHIAK